MCKAKWFNCHIFSNYTTTHNYVCVSVYVCVRIRGQCHLEVICVLLLLVLRLCKLTYNYGVELLQIDGFTSIVTHFLGAWTKNIQSFPDL